MNIKFVKFAIGCSLLSWYCCLGFGVSNAYALNLDRLKVYFLQGDYKAAITEGEKIIASTGQSKDIDELYYILGLSYLKDENFLRASDIFEIILKEFKESRFKEQAKLGLSDAYFLKGDFDKAQSYLIDLVNTDPDTKFKAQVYYRFSQIGFKKGDTQQGREYLERLKKEFPLNAEARVYKDIPLSADASPDFYYTVQVGSFSNGTNAKVLTDKLIQKGYPATIEEVNLAGGEKSYRVRVGRFTTRLEAINLENKLIQEGYPTKICP